MATKLTDDRDHPRLKWTGPRLALARSLKKRGEPQFGDCWCDEYRPLMWLLENGLLETAVGDHGTYRRLNAAGLSALKEQEKTNA